MSNVYTPNPANNPASYTMPLDGDTKPVASVRVSLEGIADAVAHANWPEADATKSPLVATQSIFRTCPQSWQVHTEYNEAALVPTWGANRITGMMTQLDVTSSHAVDHHIHIPNGAYLQSVFVNVAGKEITGHVALPATKVSFSVIQISNAAGGLTGIAGPFTDPSASVAAYDAIHQISGAVNQTVDTTQYRYMVRIFGESGANAVVGLNIVGITLQFRISNLDKGAA